ncbi:MAG: hypothetical protein WCW35_14740 [Bacteroidota bacterium]|jgi:hypothetical protein
MKIPLSGLRPTQQELMEFVDGTLPPQRFREIEFHISNSTQLQNEIALIRAMRTTVHRETLVAPSKRFTEHVMNEILPLEHESLWMRLAKNSSNLFAMVLVLSMIGIVMVSGPGTAKNDTNIVTKSIDSYSAAYNSIMENISGWANQFIQPAQQVTTTSSGKFLLLGLAAFFLFMILDEIVGKKYFHARIKH